MRRCQDRCQSLGLGPYLQCPQDLGRPMSDIVTNLLGYDNLTQDIDLVLKSLIPREITVQDKRNRWYLLRILPYRTLDNVIEGAAITFIDV